MNTKTEVNVIRKANLHKVKNADFIEQQTCANDFLNILLELHFQKNLTKFQQVKDVVA